MMVPGSYRWRKTTDVNREYAVFELLADDVPILDVGFSDEGVFELVFNEAIAGVLIEWSKFGELIEEGKTIARQDQ